MGADRRRLGRVSRKTAKEQLARAIRGASPPDVELSQHFVDTIDGLASTMLAESRPFDILLTPSTVYEHVKEFTALTRRVFVHLPLRERDSLAGGIFTECQFVDQDFTGINLQRAQCQRARFVLVKLHNTDLSEANLDEAIIPGHSFDECILKATRFERALMQGCFFSRIKGGVLDKTVFDYADLTGANFEKLTLQAVQFVGVTGRALALASSVWTECDLSMAKLGGSNAESAEFRGCKLDYSDFSWASLRDARFLAGDAGERWPIRFVDFSEAILRSVKFQNLLLTGCSFARDDLTDTRFINCELLACNFNGAHLVPSTLENTLVRHAIKDNYTIGLEETKDK